MFQIILIVHIDKLGAPPIDCAWHFPATFWCHSQQNFGCHVAMAHNKYNLKQSTMAQIVLFLVLMTFLSTCLSEEIKVSASKNSISTTSKRNLRNLEILTTTTSISLADICGRELQDICAFDADVTMIPQEEYYGRACLWRNKSLLSEGCSNYVTKTAPSIVEPCLQDIEQFCLGIVPGYGQVHTCLHNRGSELSATCSTALEEDAIRTAQVLLDSARDEEDSEDDSMSMFTSWDTAKSKLLVYLNYLMQNFVNAMPIERSEPESDDQVIKEHLDENDTEYVK